MNHFLFKKEDGTFTYIFYDYKTSSISMRSMSKNGNKSSITILYKNAEPDFSCSADKSGNIHTAFSADGGGIYYGCLSGNLFRSFKILSSKSPMDYRKNILISAAFDSVYIFYTIKHNGKNILSIQSINTEESRAESPRAIDYIYNADLRQGICESDDGFIFLSYTGVKNEACINVLKKFSSKGEVVSSFEYFPQWDSPLNTDGILCDESGEIQLLTHCPDSGKIHFHQFDGNEFINTEIANPAPSELKNSFFGLTHIYGKTTCYMVLGKTLYTCVLRGGGSSSVLEKRPFRYQGSLFRIDFCFFENRFLRSSVPGNIYSGMFIYIFNPFTDIKNEPDIMDISKMLSIEKSLSSLEKRVAQIEKKLSETDQ